MALATVAENLGLLRQFVRTYVLHAGTSPEDEAAFARCSAQNTVRFTYVGALMCSVAALFWWPLDYVIYASQPDVIVGFRYWRIATIVVCSLGAVLCRSSSYVRQHPVPILTLLTWILLFCVGDALERLGGPEQPWFHALYLVPMAAWIFFIPFKLRILHTASFPIVALAGYLLPHPEYVHSTIFANALGLIAFGTLFAITAGHVVYHLSRTNFFQQQALQQRAEQLAELDRLKNDFFANVSHEIRTPLTLIQGTLRSLPAAAGGEERAHLTEVGLRNTSRLLLLINQMLDLARFDSGRATLHKQVVDVRRLSHSVVSNFQSSLDGPTVTVEEPAGLVLAELDPRQIKTVLYNLLSNAMKFTDPRTRRIGVTIGDSGAEISFRVRDNGIGIPREELSRIFERFSRVEHGPSRTHEGTGIGLALVSEIVKQHGGHVTVESTPGVGTTFQVLIPKGRTEGALTAVEATSDEEVFAEAWRGRDRSVPRAELPPGNPSDGASVLVVEDNADLRSYVARLLGRRYHVSTAADGQEGLVRARAERPDLILSDYMMPGLSGPELAAAVRKDPGLRGTPVILLTAMASTSARVAALGIGADDYLTKPFEEEELFARIQNQLRLRKQERELATVNDRLEERVRQQTRELRALAAHLETLREDERRSIARELHDELSQTLAAMRIEVSMARRHVEEPPEDRTARLGQIDELVLETQRTVRRMLSTLRPRVLDDYGLVAGAEWLVKDFTQRTGLEVQLRVNPGDLRIDGPLATALFRILQESLTNIVKHARATRVSAELLRDETHVTLTVRDNGVGLPPPAARRPGAMGLLGMGERVTGLDGRFEASALPEGGTLISVQFPLATESEKAA